MNAQASESSTLPDVTLADSPWMNTRQAAAYLHRGQRFVRQEVQAGRLRAARVGGRGELLVRREWLDAWVEQQAAPLSARGRSTLAVSR